MGRKTEVAHVIENEQVVLMFGKWSHEWRHAKIEFATAVDVPRWRVYSVRFKEGDEAEGAAVWA